MIERFEVGKMYRYTKTTRPGGWNSSGKMDAVLDGKPRKCINAIGYSANFTDASHQDPGSMWHWVYGIENWVEVTEEYV